MFGCRLLYLLQETALHTPGSQLGKTNSGQGTHASFMALCTALYGTAAGGCCDWLAPAGSFRRAGVGAVQAKDEEEQPASRRNSALVDVLCQVAAAQHCGAGAHSVAQHATGSHTPHVGRGSQACGQGRREGGQGRFARPQAPWGASAPPRGALRSGHLRTGAAPAGLAQISWNTVRQPYPLAQPSWHTATTRQLANPGRAKLSRPWTCAPRWHLRPWPGSPPVALPASTPPMVAI